MSGSLPAARVLESFPDPSFTDAKSELTRNVKLLAMKFGRNARR